MAKWNKRAIVTFGNAGFSSTSRAKRHCEAVETLKGYELAKIDQCEKKFWWKNRKQFQKDLENLCMKQQHDRHDKYKKRFHKGKDCDKSESWNLKNWTNKKNTWENRDQRKCKSLKDKGRWKKSQKLLWKQFQKLSDCKCSAPNYKVTNPAGLSVCYQIASLNKASGGFIGSFTIFRSLKYDELKGKPALIAIKYDEDIKVKIGRSNKNDDGFFNLKPLFTFKVKGSGGNTILVSKAFIEGQLPSKKSMNKICIDDISPVKYKVKVKLGKDTKKVFGLKLGSDVKNIPISKFIPSKPYSPYLIEPPPINNPGKKKEQPTTTTQSQDQPTETSQSLIVFAVVVAVGAAFVGYTTYERRRYRNQFNRRQNMQQQNPSLAAVPDFVNPSRWKYGKKNIYFPSMIFKLIRTPSLPPNQVAFKIPRSLNKLDIHSYLTKLYKLDIVDIRTMNYQAKRPSLNKYSKRVSTKSTSAYKKAIVILTEDFNYPPISIDYVHTPEYITASESLRESHRRLADFDTKSLDHLIKYNCEKILYNYSASFRSSDYGVYVGYAGIAYLFFHLYNLTPELKIAGDNVSLLCTTYLASALSALDYSTSKHVGFLDTHVGPLALATGNSNSNIHGNDNNNLKESLKHLKKLITKYHEIALNEDSNELLYGRVGYLYALKLIQNYCKDSKEIMELVNNGVIKEVWDKVFEEGNWHGKRYLGAVHGVAGILAILLEFKDLAEQHLDDLFKTLEWLTRQVSKKNGNYLISVESNRMIPAFLKIHSLYPTNPLAPTLLNSCINASQIVWKYGILKKGLTGLCHNAIGNAYSFLLLYLTTKDELQLQRALAIGLHAGNWEEETRKGSIKVPDRPWSLWEGLAGGVC
nr:10031_t:CDS:10 [Entrophospora candida]